MKKHMQILSVLLTVFLWSAAGMAQDVKWEETFDSDTPPAGWLRFDNDGSGLGFTFEQGIEFLDKDSAVVGTVAPQAGERFWFSNFENANDASGLINEWLISPRIPGIESGDQLMFYAGAFDQGFDDSLRVFISTTDSAVASFTTQIAYFKVDGPVGEYTEYAFDLSDFAGSDIFVAVNYYIVDGGPDGASSEAVWLDHFVVTSTVTSVEKAGVLPDFSLSQNYPNPFNPSTQISFSIAKESEVSLTVFNLLGQKVAVLLDGKSFAPGAHSVSFDASGLPNGIYYYKIEAGEFTDFKKMTLLK